MRRNLTRPLLGRVVGTSICVSILVAVTTLNTGHSLAIAAFAWVLALLALASP